MNLFKPLGGLLYTALLATLIGPALWVLGFFVQSRGAWVVSAALFAIVLVFTTRLSARVLSLSEDEGAWWVAFTTTILSAVIWGEYVKFLEVREVMSQLGSLGGGFGGDESLLLSSFYSPNPLLTVILFQIALLVGAYALLWPGVKGGLLNKNRLVLPLAGAMLGGIVGWLVMSLL